MSASQAKAHFTDRTWNAVRCADFALAVAEILRDWKAGDLNGDEAMSRVSYEYTDKIGELDR